MGADGACAESGCESENHGTRATMHPGYIRTETKQTVVVAKQPGRQEPAWQMRARPHREGNQSLSYRSKPLFDVYRHAF